MWDQGLRHGPATYYHPNGNKEEATYVEGYEEVKEKMYLRRNSLLLTGRVNCVLCKREGGEEEL